MYHPYCVMPMYHPYSSPEELMCSPRVEYIPSIPSYCNVIKKLNIKSYAEIVFEKHYPYQFFQERSNNIGWLIFNILSLLEKVYTPSEIKYYLGVASPIGLDVLESGCPIILSYVVWKTMMEIYETKGKNSEDYVLNKIRNFLIRTGSTLKEINTILDWLS